MILLIAGVWLFPNQAKAMYILGGDLGMVSQQSASVNEMNNRLGNSILFEHKYEFGRANSYGGRLGYTDKAERFRLMLDVYYYDEKLLGTSLSTHVLAGKSDLSFGNYLGVGSFRLYPLQLKAKGSAAAKKQIKKFYLFVNTYAGITNIAHDFSLVWAEKGTDIVYNFNAYHFTYGAGLEIGRRFLGSVDVYALWDSLFSTGLTATPQVKSFMLEGANFNGGSDPGGVKALALKPINFWKIGLGISLVFKD